jgi:hypothetical protein
MLHSMQDSASEGCMWKERVKTLLVEIAIGMTVVAIAILYATYGPFRWLPHRKWITLAMLCSAVWGLPLWWYRGSWRRPFFWVTIATLFVLYVVAYSILLARIKEFPPLLAATSCPLAWLVIFPIVRKAAR